MKFRPVFLLPLIPLLGISVGWYVFHGRGPQYQTATVTKGPITQEVLASGNTEASTTAHMHFKISGQLAALLVTTGQVVHKGDLLARLDDTALVANYNAAAAAEKSARASLDKVLAGASSADIAVTKSAQGSAETSVQNAQGALNETINTTATNISSILGSQVDQLFSQPQTSNPGFGITIVSGSTQYFITTTAVQQVTISNLRSQVKQDLANLQTSVSDHDALLVEAQKAQDALKDMSMLLAEIAAVVNTYVPADTTAKSVYQSYQTSIATARTTVTTSQQSLVTNLANYQSAQAARDTADANLAKVTAPARSQDVTAAQAVLSAATAKAQAAAAALGDARLVAPADGTITDTNGVVGEVIDPSTSVVSLMPKSILDVKAHVSEDSIIGVKVGDPVRIELDAFPAGTSFAGIVTRIDPAETVIGGAVYYLTTIQFASSSPLTRPGMTTNVWIETGHASSTLIVPESALTRTSTSTYVSILRGKQAIHQLVTTGLADQNGMVEITSGLTAGQRVILGQ